MKRKLAMLVTLLSLAFIAAVIATSFISTSTQPSSEAQHVRMYFVFAAYITLLLAVRVLIRTREDRLPTASWIRGLKVVAGSIAASGAVFICGVVLSVVIGGPDAVESVIPKLLYAVPAIAIIAAPFLMKRMT